MFEIYFFEQCLRPFACCAHSERQMLRTLQPCRHAHRQKSPLFKEKQLGNFFKKIGEFIRPPADQSEPSISPLQPPWIRPPLRNQIQSWTLSFTAMLSFNIYFIIFSELGTGSLLHLPPPTIPQVQNLFYTFL